MPKWANFIETSANKLKSGSKEGAWYAEHRIISIVTISQISSE